jgi:hypothetical protein
MSDNYEKDGIAKKFGFRPHSNPTVRKMLPEEIEVGWHFTDGDGKTSFWKWGSTNNKETLAKLIEDVQTTHGPIEVIDLTDVQT